VYSILYRTSGLSSFFSSSLGGAASFFSAGAAAAAGVGAGLGVATGVTGAAFLLLPSLGLGDVDFFPAQKAAVHRRVTTATNNGEKRIDWIVHIVDPAAKLASVR
ncbi:hypothetical protein PENTCL1PPCAC_23178, partial [Pristionchus entomophagus]